MNFDFHRLTGNFHLYNYSFSLSYHLVELKGVEPSTSCLQSTRSSQLSYSPMIIWWAYLDLNQGPRPYQGRALTN